MVTWYQLEVRSRLQGGLAHRDSASQPAEHHWLHCDKDMSRDRFSWNGGYPGYFRKQALLLKLGDYVSGTVKVSKSLDSG